MDRTSKAILSAIAIGLWLNFTVAVFRPTTASADDAMVTNVYLTLSTIANGTCANHKICGD